MRLARLIVLAASIMQLTWLYLIANRYGILPIAVTFFGAICLPIWLLRASVAFNRLWSQIVLGALFGYLGGIVAAFVAEFSLRGFEIFERTYPMQNLYWFPILSMGWLFGIVWSLFGASAFLQRKA